MEDLMEELIWKVTDGDTYTIDHRVGFSTLRAASPYNESCTFYFIMTHDSVSLINFLNK